MRVIVTRRPIIARSLSFLWVQRIYIGTRYAALPYFARRAAIAHETAHLAGHHTEWRLLTALFAPFLMRWLCHRQEYRADADAAATGHLHGMLYLLHKDRPASLTHPKNMDRRIKLMHSPTYKSLDRRNRSFAWFGVTD